MRHDDVRGGQGWTTIDDVDPDRDLPMWTVYDSPLDYPGKFVARCWVVKPNEPEPLRTGSVIIAPTLEIVRRMLPPGLHCLVRSEGDEPTIVETWL